MTTLGERVKAERRAKGWSQAELARRVTRAGYSITQGGIAQIERRGDTEPKSIVQLAQALQLSVNWLQSNRGDKTLGATLGEDDEQLSLAEGGRRGRRGGAAAASAAARAASGRPPLQVFASAQGGSEGAMLLSNEPVSWIPRDPRLEGIQDAYGCFVSDGSRYVLIKRLVRRNEGSWTVKQYNPAKTYTLSRREWQKAHLVIGKYNRAS
jgi:transcriptional regulator with XRE-family HTH domain